MQSADPFIYDCSCIFQACAASFKSDQTGAAHFHDAVGFQQLNKSVDLRGLAANLDDQCLRGIVGDLRTEDIDNGHNILPLVRYIVDLDEQQFADDGLILFQDLDGLDIVHLFQLLDDLIADAAVAVNQLMEIAQQTADQYVESVKQSADEEKARIIEAAKAEAARIAEEAKVKIAGTTEQSETSEENTEKKEGEE